MPFCIVQAIKHKARAGETVQKSSLQRVNNKGYIKQCSCLIAVSTLHLRSKILQIIPQVLWFEHGLCDEPCVFIDLTCNRAKQKKKKSSTVFLSNGNLFCGWVEPVLAEEGGSRQLHALAAEAVLQKYPSVLAALRLVLGTPLQASQGPGRCGHLGAQGRRNEFLR